MANAFFKTNTFTTHNELSVGKYILNTIPQANRCPPVPSGGTPVYLNGEGALNKGLPQTFDSRQINDLPQPMKKGIQGSPWSSGRGVQREDRNSLREFQRNGVLLCPRAPPFGRLPSCPSVAVLSRDGKKIIFPLKKASPVTETPLSHHLSDFLPSVTPGFRPASVGSRVAFVRFGASGSPEGFLLPAEDAPDGEDSPFLRKSRPARRTM